MACYRRIRRKSHPVPKEVCIRGEIWRFPLDGVYPDHPTGMVHTEIQNQIELDQKAKIRANHG